MGLIWLALGLVCVRSCRIISDNGLIYPLPHEWVLLQVNIVRAPDRAPDHEPLIESIVHLLVEASPRGYRLDLKRQLMLVFLLFFHYLLKCLQRCIPAETFVVISYHQVTPLITIRVVHYPDYVYRAQSGPDHVPSPALQHFRGLRHLLRYYAIQLS